MKKLKLITIINLLAFAIAFQSSSCKKDEVNNNQNNSTGSIVIEFDHVWGMNMAPFQMNTDIVQPMSGDTLNVSLLKYYISNIQLVKNNGDLYNIEDGYYLIDPENNTIELENIPSGEYKGVNFLIGVDSLKNFSGLQTGALNPSNGMFWSWSTGYIFVRIEGSSQNSPTGQFLYHMGGYQDPYIASHKKEMLFGGEIATVSPNATPQAHLNVNVAKIWHGPIKVSDLNVIHNIGEDAVLLSTNFADGFTFAHLHK